MYEVRPAAGAIVHLHSTHCVAVSCMDGLDPVDAFLR
jgi:ribulose-5-phosphate 4-epimerase/fuculose-1-phosphate aldolase